MTLTLEQPRIAIVSPDMLLNDLVRAHPQARAVLDRHGLTDCGGRDGPAESISFFARMHGMEERALLAELSDAIACKAPGPLRAPARVNRQSIADVAYRWFFLSAILVVLTAGATWGAVLLWQIAFMRQFTGVSLHAINAHGSAQIFGWMGLFIMGFAYQAFPRMWNKRLAWPILCAPVLAFTLEGIVLVTLGSGLHARWAFATPLAVAGAILHVAASLVFVLQIVKTYRTSTAELEPYVGFIFAALFWLVAMRVMNAWHTWTTLSASHLGVLLWHVATYQAPLRDMQIHGLAVSIILGVSLRTLPAMYGMPAAGVRRAWSALALLTAGVIGECVLFVAYRWSNHHVVAAFLMIPWLMVAVACGMVALPWKLWRTPPITDRSLKFVRIAYLWLGVSLVMLLMFPAYMHAVHLPVSHAYYGAIRHAITVGFVSVMIMGFAAKIVPMLGGIDPSRLGPMWGPFLLINIGCFLRVSTQTLTDVNRGFFAVIGISGMLEVTALAWWGASLTRIMLGKRRLIVPEELVMIRPRRIKASHRVGDVIDWFPALLEVLVSRGFAPLANPIARRTLARAITLEQAASMRGVDAGELVAALNQRLGSQIASDARTHIK